MSGLLRDFETSEGVISLRRPSYDTMKKQAAAALPLMDNPDPLAVYESEAVKKILLSSVTEDTRRTLEQLFESGDFIDPIELWKGYCAFCKFDEVFIWPREAAEKKAIEAKAEELGAMFSAMIKGGVITKEEVSSLMKEATGSERNRGEPASMSSSEPTTAGAAATSEPKTSG